MKIFITGVGSDLGTNIARLLEQRKDVEAIAGVDMFPPRRYLARTQFSMSHYDDSERISDVITQFSPDVIINFGLYEPGARLTFSRARGATHASLAGIIHAVGLIEKKHPVRVVTRSSVVAYGFDNPERTRDETTPLSPDTPYGEMCRDVEEELLSALDNVTIIRTAPEIGAHVPHPLARLLMLPALPVQLRMPFAHDIGFPVISPRDVNDLFVLAACDNADAAPRILHGACSSNATMMMAIHAGKRVPIYTSGFGFTFVKRVAYLSGAPIDPHIEMFIRRGMMLDSTATRMYFSITSQDSASEIIKDLYSGREKAFDSSVLTEVPR